MRVLAVGVATLDIINQVNEYPTEDTEVRAVAQRRKRGGNATNTLVVLAQLGHGCEWAGVIADEPDAKLILDDLAHYGIGTQHLLHLAQGKLPTSYITLNQATASRTIVHYRDLPEYPASTFCDIDVQAFDWIHFEGRQVPELGRMLARLQTTPRKEGPRCSLEIEKPRAGIEALFPLADLLLFSRHYARARGFEDATSLLEQMVAPGQPAVCAWGEQGAWGRDAAGRVHHSPAVEPAQVLDTLGAGDVFNAAMIDAWSETQNMQHSLDAATRLAGRKCAQHGFAGIFL